MTVFPICIFVQDSVGIRSIHASYTMEKFKACNEENAMVVRDTPNDDPAPGVTIDAWLMDTVERAKAREQRAFHILFDYYNSQICTHLIRLVRSESITHDLAQKTFFKAWEQLPTLHQPACFKSWLYKIATNEAHDYLRRVRPTEPLLEAEEGYPMPHHLVVEGPERQVEEADQIQRLLAQLPTQQRTCLVLQVEGFTQKEIAEFLGISEKNVSVCISRAREKCRELMRSMKGEKA